jgi:kynurenine formamidase
VRRGATFGLDYPLEVFDPSIARRTPPRHVIVSSHRDQRDEYLDGFWPQASSQIDGLRHRRHHEHGFYNGIGDDEVTAGSPAIGINRWADRPIVGRGVLIDVAAFRAEHGGPIDHDAGEHLTVDLLDAALARQGTALQPGDCVMVRTGWAEWYLALDHAARTEVCRTRRCTGLAQGQDTLAWLWDNQVGLAAADTFAFEALPARPDSPFGGETDAGMMHQDLIALLGLPLGELWRLHELADDCAGTGTYDSLLVVKPLNLTGGVGSPANAVAIR